MAIDPIYLEKNLEQVQWIWVIANFPREFLKLKAGSQSRSYSDWWFHTSPNMLVIRKSSCPIVVETCFQKNKTINQITSHILIWWRKHLATTSLQRSNPPKIRAPRDHWHLFGRTPWCAAPHCAPWPPSVDKLIYNQASFKVMGDIYGYMR